MEVYILKLKEPICMITYNENGIDTEVSDLFYRKYQKVNRLYWQMQEELACLLKDSVKTKRYNQEN